MGTWEREVWEKYVVWLFDVGRVLDASESMEHTAVCACLLGEDPPLYSFFFLNVHDVGAWEWWWWWWWWWWWFEDMGNRMSMVMLMEMKKGWDGDSDQEM